MLQRVLLRAGERCVRNPVQSPRTRGTASMTTASLNNQLALTNGENASADFTPIGATISKKGQACGTITDTEIARLANEPDAVDRIVRKIEELIGEPPMTRNTRAGLHLLVQVWLDEHY